MGAEADKASFTEEVGRIWGGREEGRHGVGATVINMNKGLDARMGELMTSGETRWARAPDGGRS